MEVLFDNRRRNKVKVYVPYTEFDEICLDPTILLLSGGTTLNKISR